MRVQKPSDRGQALVEYLLMILLALSVVGILGFSFRKSIRRLWIFYIREVSAPCPGCAPSNPTYRYD